MAKNAFNLRKEMLKKSLNKDMMKRITKAIIWSVAETWTYYIGKKISGDWRLLRCFLSINQSVFIIITFCTLNGCGCGGRWKRSAGEIGALMKKYCKWHRKKEVLWMS